MWSPKSESDIRSAIANETLAESSTFDCKQETGGTDGARKETARDLASFAVDGGQLLIGVAEDKANRTWHLHPIELAGQGEKINQIAQLRVDPPLNVVARDIPSQADPRYGYLLVEIPPSPQAPHMVEGVYFARGDRTKRRLSDAEVLRLHAARRAQSEWAQQLLKALMERDPVPIADQVTGHLYMIAEPVLERAESAIDLVRGDVSVLRAIIEKVEGTLHIPWRQATPNPYSASHPVVRSSGRAFSSLVDGSLPSDDNVDEQSLTDIEFLESGAVHVISGGFRRGDRIVDTIAVIYAQRLVGWVAAIADATGYRGAWTFGLSGTNLAGARSSRDLDNAAFAGSLPKFDRDAYESSTTAHLTEIQETPWVIASALTARLCRGLGTADDFSRAFAPPSSE